MLCNSTFKKLLLPVYLVCLSIGLALLVATSFSTEWMVVKTREDLDIRNITLSETSKSKDVLGHLNLDKTYSFGLKKFCVTVYYEQLEKTEKECHNIAVFKQNLERAALEDALKFQILSLVLATFPILTTFALSCCQDGPVKKVVTYSTIALIVFSGTCLVSSCFMVTSTFTEDSGIIKNNIMAHIGHARINLKSIEKGPGFHMAISALIFLGLALLSFVLNLFAKKNNNTQHEEENQDYRLLITEQQ